MGYLRRLGSWLSRLCSEEQKGSNPPPERLEIQRLWSVSTGHITSDDAKLLSQVNVDLVVTEYSEGFWVMVPPEGVSDAFLRELTAAGLSTAIGHILSVASSNNIDWVHFDSIAPLYTFLDQFHW